MREQQVEHRTITFFEVRAGAIELQARSSLAPRTEPQPHHVFDLERPRSLLVELEPVELVLREKIRVLARTVGGCQRILMAVPDPCLVDLGSHLATRLTDPDDRGFRIVLELFVVGDNVARDEPPEHLEHRLRKRNSAVHVSRLG